MATDQKTVQASIDSILAIIEERDRLYGERIESLKILTQQAHTALSERTTHAFLSAEKAIDKAETAQKAYNERSNEFRAALDDAQKNLITRPEAQAEFLRSVERIEDLKKEIAGLREFRSTQQGHSSGVTATWAIIYTTLGFVLAIVGLFLKNL